MPYTYSIYPINHNIINYSLFIIIVPLKDALSYVQNFMNAL